MHSRSLNRVTVWGGDRIVGHIVGTPSTGWTATNASGDRLGLFLTPGGCSQSDLQQPCG